MCHREIKAGDEYECEVEATDFGFQVTKIHIRCPDDFWEEEEENDRRADEYYENQQRELQASQAEAA